MKKIILTLVILISFCSAAIAAVDVSDMIEKFPVKQGIAYSIVDNGVNYLSTIELAKYKGVTFEAGYSGPIETTGHKLVGVISYPLVKLGDYMTVPILELVELNVGGYIGFGKIDIGDAVNEDNNKLDYGISATLIQLKF